MKTARRPTKLSRLLVVAGIAPLLVAAAGCSKAAKLTDLPGLALDVTVPATGGPGVALPGIVVKVTVLGEPPCAEPGDVRATLDGTPLALVERGGQQGDWLSKGGPRCSGPLFNGPAPAGAASSTVAVFDSSGRVEADIVGLGVARTITLETSLRAGAEAVIKWSPATDDFPARDPPRVSFEPDDPANAAAAWEVPVGGARADGPRIRFRVPATAREAAGKVRVSTWSDWPYVAPHVSRCTGARACFASVRLPRTGVVVPARVSR